jgi:hypothetical protein
VGEPAAQPVTLHRTWTGGGVRAALGSSHHVFLLALLGVVFVVRAFGETSPRDAGLLALLGIALVGWAAVHWACVLLARVEVDGEVLRVRGPFGTASIRAGEIRGFRRDGATAVLLLRRTDRKRIRLPARVALDDEFFGWLTARAPESVDGAGPGVRPG